MGGDFTNLAPGSKAGTKTDRLVAVGLTVAAIWQSGRIVRVSIVATPACVRKILITDLCLVGEGDQHEIMLKIQHAPLPQSLLSYVAFRVAFRETFERLALHKRHAGDASEAYGYLAEVPFLREVPVQVQLDLLAATWHKHLSREAHLADLVDESVIYAVCETAARLVEHDPAVFASQMRGGPLDLAVPVDPYLARELRLLYLELPNDGDFLLVSQFLDLDPDESIEQKLEMGVDPKKLGAMFDVLGRWHVSPQFLSRLKGLLTEGEINRVATILGTPCPA